MCSKGARDGGGFGKADKRHDDGAHEQVTSPLPREVNGQRREACRNIADDRPVITGDGAVDDPDDYGQEYAGEELGDPSPDENNNACDEAQPNCAYVPVAGMYERIQRFDKETSVTRHISEGVGEAVTS